MNSLLLKTLYCCALIGCIQAGNTHIVVGGVVIDGQRVYTPRNNANSVRGGLSVRASANLSVQTTSLPSLFRTEQSVIIDPVSGSITNNSSVRLDFGNCMRYIAFFIGGCSCLYGLRKMLNKEYMTGGTYIGTPAICASAYYVWMKRHRNR